MRLNPSAEKPFPVEKCCLQLSLNSHSARCIVNMLLKRRAFELP